MNEIHSDPSFDVNYSTEAPPKNSRNRWWQLLIWLAVIALLVLVGLMLLKRQQGPLQVGKPVPDFTLSTFDGEEITLSSLTGKVVLINFWASWCKPCEQEAADLETAWLQNKDSGDVVFLGIAWTDSDKNAMEYIQKFSISYPNGPDLGTRISQKYRITGVPETFVVDQDGNLAYFKFSPFISVQEIQSVLDDLLAAGASTGSESSE